MHYHKNKLLPRGGGVSESAEIQAHIIDYKVVWKSIWDIDKCLSIG